MFEIFYNENLSVKVINSDIVAITIFAFFREFAFLNEIIQFIEKSQIFLRVYIIKY